MRRVAVTLAPLSLAAGLASVLPAASAELTVIVNRSDAGTEVYLSAPAPDLFTLTATSPDVVPGGGGAVDIAAFSQGTWEIGDALFANSRLEIGGAAAPLEAMSFMLHAASEAMPMDTPLDALMAIELCNVAEPGQTQDWDALVGYVGYFTPRVAAGDTITLDLPLQTEVTARVIDAATDGTLREWRTTLGPKEALLLSPPETRQSGLWPLGGLAVFAAVVCAALIGRLRRA
ncbi:MAG: hypothetical protein AAGM84_03490 [Pseudomonadota bacterium]